MGLMAMLEKALNGEAATVTLATSATVKPKTRPSVASVATVTVTSSLKPETAHPNLRLVYPQQTGQEAALYAERLQLFQDKGITNHDAAVLANRLVRRDNQDDDRRSCAECLSFDAGNCRQRITPIGETTIYTLHRCKGFKHTEMASNSKWPETQ